MDLLKKYWPHAFNASDEKTSIITLVVYLVVALILVPVIGFLGGIPVVGIIFKVIAFLVELYCAIGIVLVILNLFKVLK